MHKNLIIIAFDFFILALFFFFVNFSFQFFCIVVSVTVFKIKSGAPYISGTNPYSGRFLIYIYSRPSLNYTIISYILNLLRSSHARP